MFFYASANIDVKSLKIENAQRLMMSMMSMMTVIMLLLMLLMMMMMMMLKEDLLFSTTGAKVDHRLSQLLLANASVVVVVKHPDECDI